jgi:UDP-galactopyranose mutase
LSQVGTEIYEIFIKGYTKKQWKKSPKELSADIIKRLPIRFTFNENYYNDKYGGIPINGYTKMVEGMLDGIEVRLNQDYFVDRNNWNAMAKKVVYTGKIDEFFDYVHGDLEYRSLKFEHTWHDGDFQGNAAINYADEEIPYTRTVEHKHFLPEKLCNQNKTIVTYEYPVDYSRDSVPYYPMSDQKNLDIYRMYERMSLQQNDIIFGGRLAEYKYYDMHQVIGSALMKAKRELGEIK